MFSIDTEKIRLNLEIVKSDSLLQHEETLPAVADKLSIEFKGWGILHDPVIIEKNNIVLDGNHRSAVFKKLKIKYIPVCRIDYFNKEVKLRYWFRVFRDIKDKDVLFEEITALGGLVEEVSDMMLLEKQMADSLFSSGLQYHDSARLLTFPIDIVSDAAGAYSVLNKLENRLKARGAKLEYLPCGSVMDGSCADKIGKNDLIIRTPFITKEMVVKTAEDKKVFAPKTTRHLIPARPLNINVPTFWMKENVSLEVVNERFSEHLNNKKIKHFGSGQVLKGRYYEEELFVFY